MNETLLLIISYLPAAVSLLGSIAAAIYSIKKVTSKMEDLDTLKHHLGFICKKLAEAQDLNAKLIKEIEAIRMHQKGIKEHGKESISKD